ncbi:MAG: TIR domain-containing protein [Leptolyngbyaceae cyanobacterium RM2_2_4]|nr:TIR domain-containing protein [Leptolyngbyaceae cyanobacterium SM1_4_3]NJO49321.1 TIR domain-containing protein [Leptolyngbyaceae cyanobacterium RM2_2_4]
MNTLPNNSSKPLFVSTFLSHSSTDKPLVEAMDKRTGRRGVLAWLNRNELLEMGPLDIILKQAVQRQATLTIFLSEASLASNWCKDELRWALEQVRRSNNHSFHHALIDTANLIG